MKVFEYLAGEVDNRYLQVYQASIQSVKAMNSLVQQALKTTALSCKREGRLLFIATAFGLESLESTKLLSQAQVSTMIEFLKAPEDWSLKDGIQKDIAAIAHACLKKLGQLEIEI